jgi:transaldolase/glucose-6-phosphate isomerase
MRIALASDHAGFELKEDLRALLDGLGHETLDLGTHDTQPVDYPDYAAAVAAAVVEGRAARGVLVCGSGVGASVAANKVVGVRAGLAHDTYSAHQGVEHDDMNVLVLGGRVIGHALAHELVRAFVAARFSGEERHRRRLAKVHALETERGGSAAAVASAPGAARSRLRAIVDLGQSIWLDNIRRSLLTSGELERLIVEDGLGGVTSNPSIFEKAIAGSTDYRDLLEAPESRDLAPVELYERIAIRDIRDAADRLRPVYEQTRWRDGYVSLEVSPQLAHDTNGTVAEARRLWRTVGRENLMVKVPATPEGIPAIERLIGEGVNVNVTLLFSQAAYERVVDAYMGGLERRLELGGDLARVASVASFFVSRIDSAVDGILAERAAGAGTPAERALLRGLQGKVAIANAKATYQRALDRFASPRWQALAARGARSQRVLWASTSTKNPAYRDVLYVEELIGPDSVDTVPPATLDAFRDHGRARASLAEDVEGAYEYLAALEKAGVSLDEVTAKLLEDGVRLFSEAFDKLLEAVAPYAKGGRRPRADGPGAARINRQTASLPGALGEAVEAALREWREHGKVRRLWTRDPSLWTGADEGRWLGWLDVAEDRLAHLAPLRALAEEVRVGGFRHVLLLGMGGSSLAPEVMAAVLGPRPGHPELRVLDSTDPAQIRAVERSIDPAHTLFVVSSKSGSTLEPILLEQYFFERARAAVGDAEVGRRFVAVTDPGSQLELRAEGAGFRRVFHGRPSIGGRYSALSNFGLVPAALAGIDVGVLLDRAEEMVHACATSVPVEENPGVVLGAILGVAASGFGRDKVTLVASPALAPFGAWLEQLLAESTGKRERGLVPVDQEPLGPPEAYGTDRVFAYLRLESAPDPAQDAALDALARADHPVVRIAVDEVLDLGEEFFRWQMATAVASAILGVDAFDQPDVEASKVAARKLVAAVEHSGRLPEERPVLVENGLGVYADAEQARALAGEAGGRLDLDGVIRAHLGLLEPGDYFALLAFLERSAAHAAALRGIRVAVRDARHVATCAGFGPRFLHSTGQLHKGGPDRGVFLQITCDDADDIPVPGRRYTFGTVKAAQARGDLEVLRARGRRALRVHLGSDVAGGLERLAGAVERGLR